MTPLEASSGAFSNMISKSPQQAQPPGWKLKPRRANSVIQINRIWPPYHFTCPCQRAESNNVEFDALIPVYGNFGKQADSQIGRRKC